MLERGVRRRECGGFGHAGPETRDHRQIGPRVVHRQISRLGDGAHRKRQGDLGIAAGNQARELRRRDADDGDHLTVGDDRAPEDGRVATEPAGPVGIADDGDHRAAGVAITLGVESTAVRDRDAEQTVEVAAGPETSDGVETVARFHFEAGRAVRGHAGEHVGERRVAIEQRIVGADAGLRAAGAVREKHELVDIGKRQRAQQNRVHQAEDRGVRADAQAEREHGGGRESGCLSHQARGVAHVLAELVEETNAARLTAVLFGRIEPTEFEPGPPPGFLAAQAGPLQIGGLELEVQIHFVAHLALEPIAASEDPDERSQPRQHRYTSSGVAFNAAPIAVASRFHSAVSSRSRRRPAVVNV